jgi:uncharacterized protein
MKSKLTLVVGASTNPERYAYKAIKSLRNHDHKVVAYGLKEGRVGDVEITKEWPDKGDHIHTVTLYIGPKNQETYIDKVIELHPKRVIFNPGTENDDFYKKLDEHHIPYEEACTLVKLSIGDY